MALITCPDCDAQFVSRSRAPVCPTCGADIEEARSRLADEDDRPSRRRRRRDDDDDFDDRPSRRRRRAGKDPTVPILLVCGLVFALLVVGGFAFGLYQVLTRDRDQAAAPPPPPGFAPQPPAFQPVNPPPPAPNWNPPGRPAVAPAGPAASGVAVTLSNLRRQRGFGARDEFVVDYEFTAGAPFGLRDVLVVQSSTGRTEVEVVGGLRQRGTISWNAGFGQAGRIEVWMERKDRPGNLGRGTKVSNTVTLN
jgi:hypothetical protein